MKEENRTLIWKKFISELRRLASVMRMSRVSYGTLGVYLRLTVMLALLSGILVGLGFVIGGLEIAWMFFLVSLFMNFLMYMISDKIVLFSTGTKIVSKQEAPRLHEVVERVAAKAGIPKPKVGIIRSNLPNAFATGRGPGSAVVAATTALVDRMDDDELEAVIAHEVGHVLHRDTLVMTIAVAIATAISYIANSLLYAFMLGGARSSRDRDGAAGAAMLGAAVAAPVAASLIQLAISRSREFYADEESGLLTGKPLSLASALRKIEEFMRMGAKVRAPPSTAALWISNPFRGSDVLELFSTHPSTRKRIERLEALDRRLRMR
jgi:heat shock protein HtpX